ncbi:YdbL family protein [Sphingomonas sabuli]|uniref:YdbL family protein n=1 Tax=Sphingomonas sabuli TaxID=2764186 RepID=A0A7G9L4H6_9SPHN|nr:YdbL family protein [Sphingomonas sabuli]QNM83525.1 YdbL family protein [Sphingomonas sabuli]
MILARLIGAIVVAVAVPALAQDTSALVQARQAGVIGERFDGYLGHAATASDAVRRQAASINIRRRSLYTGLAQRRGVTVQEVGITAGCELLAGVRTGEIYMLSDGVWRKRQPGQPAAVPDYCG